MSKIDIYNYEAFLLDFSEGNLTHDQQLELEIFVMQHPELAIDLSELSKLSLTSEDIYFDNKQSLKKNIKDLISQNTFIEYIENQLSDTDKFILEKNCFENPELAKELNLYQQTKVFSYNTIIYNNKHGLKKKTKIIWFNFSIMQYSAAASILFLIGLLILWPNTNEIVTTNRFASLINSSSKLDTFETKHSHLKNSTIEPSKVGRQKPIIFNTYKKQQSIKLNSKLNSVTQHKLNSGKDIQMLDNIDTTTSIVLANQTQTNGFNDKLPQNIDQIKIDTQKNTTLVLVEADDELIITPTQKKKKGLWAFAEKTLNRLNKLGIKAVNGTETSSNDISSYTLNIGEFTIKHKGVSGF